MPFIHSVPLDRGLCSFLELERRLSTDSTSFLCLVSRIAEYDSNEVGVNRPKTFWTRYEVQRIFYTLLSFALLTGHMLHTPERLALTEAVDNLSNLQILRLKSRLWLKRPWHKLVQVRQFMRPIRFTRLFRIFLPHCTAGNLPRSLKLQWNEVYSCCCNA